MSDPFPSLRSQRDLYESQPGLIESQSIRIVAVRGAAFVPSRGGGDWAAYYMTYAEISDWWERDHENDWQGQLHLVDAHISEHGHKIALETAKFSFFPQIQGAYRE